MRKLLSFLAATLLSLGLTGAALAADIPPLGKPILLTSLGQAPDVHTVSVLAKRAKVDVDYKTFASAADLEGKKTMFIVVGVSLKGFGSAGVNLDTESARCNELFQAAKDKGVYTVLVHVGGVERRDQMSQKLLDLAAPLADAFIVFDQANQDGYFNQAAGEKPLVLLPKTMELVKLLPDMVSAS